MVVIMAEPLSEKNNLNLAGLLKSIFIGFIVLIISTQTLSTYIIQPLIFDSTLVRHGRYAIPFDAWETIEKDEQYSVVGIGSSLTQYGLNGSCIDLSIMTHDVGVYNLGIPGGYPYVEMMQTERAINSRPDVIILELNPINLFSFSDATGLNDYIEMRFEINSLFLKISDFGGWEEIIRVEDLSHIDHPLSNPYNSENTYFNSAAEFHLKSLVGSEINDGSWAKNAGLQYLAVPEPHTSEWNNYLQNPPLLPRYLDTFNNTELEYYENTTIPNFLERARYNPHSESNLNKLALEYMVKTFSNNGIKTILLSYPIYPTAVSLLSENQFDQHNNTILDLSGYDNVESLNLIWLDIWENQDFYDIEHLDVSGREKVCSIMSAKLAEMI